MRLRHSTSEIERLHSILREGIKLPSETNIREWRGNHRYHDVICLSAIEEEDIGEPSVWGRYDVYISDDYVRDHSHQFRTHTTLGSRSFPDFVKKHGIQEYQDERGVVDNRDPNQMLSLAPISVEAIEKITMKPNIEFDEIKKIKPEHVELTTRKAIR